MTDIVKFLLAQISVDEQRAQDAGEGDRGDWGIYFDGLGGYGSRDVKSSDGMHIVHAATSTDEHTGDEVQPNGAQAEHIAAWDPKRVLAECEAKRRVLEIHHLIVEAEPPPRGPRCAVCLSRANGWPCPTLRSLAAVYDDGTGGFDPSWRL